MKKYELYLSRLVNFAKASGISITWKRLDSHEAYYSPGSNSIVIDDELEEEQEIAFLLHELGHAMDEYRVDRLNQDDISDAYTAWYEGRDTKSQKKKVVKEEKTAWRIGRIIAKNLKIPLGKWYTRESKEGLSVYRAGIKKSS